jgi:molybdopterin-guanine dinucleotide biosynthesis protein A
LLFFTLKLFLLFDFNVTITHCKKFIDRAVAIITGIVLAGGKGIRFGSDKLLIKLEDQYLLNLVTAKISKLTHEIIIVTSLEQYGVVSGISKNERIVTDLIPGKAAMGGIYTGLSTASNSLCLVVGCDMPLLNLNLIQHMINEAAGYDVAMPRIGEYVEPLHAVYSKNCLPVMSRMITDNNLQINRLLKMVNTRYISSEEIDRLDPQHLSVFNINTQDDLARARSILESMPHD